MRKRTYSNTITKAFFLLSVLLLLSASVLSYKRLEMLAASEEKVKLSHRVITRLERLGSFIKDAETSQRGFVITQDTLYLIPLEDAKVKVAAVLNELTNLTRNDEIQSQNLIRIRKAVDERFRHLELTQAIFRRTGIGPELIAAMTLSREAMFEIRSRIEKMAQKEDELLHSRNKTHGRNQYLTPLAALFLTIIALFLLLLSYLKIVADSKKLKAWNRASEEARLAKESAEIYQSLIHDLPAAIYTCDNDGYVRLFNRAAVKLWGTEPAPGSKWGADLQTFDTDGKPVPVSENPVVQLIEHDKLVQRELIIERPDGERRHIDVYPQRLTDATGKKNGALVMILDVTEQRNQQKALEETEMRLRVATENSNIATWDLNLETDVLSSSGMLNTVFGFDTDRPLDHQELVQMVHPDDRTNILSPALTRALETGIYEYEVRITTLAGEERWIRTRGKVLFDSAGCATRILGITTNVTDEKIARHKIEVLGAIVKYSDDAIISKTLEGIITSWNDSATRIFGYTEEEMIGKHIFTIIPEDRRHEEEVIIATLMRGERLDHFETKRLTKDGRLVDISLTISPLKDETGMVIGASKIGRDITQQLIQAELARESEIRFRSLVDNAPVMVWMSEIDKKASYFNSSWLSFVGQTMEEQMGHGWLSSVHPDDLDRVLTSFENASDKKEEFYIEYRLRRFDGVYRWVSNKSAPRFAGGFLGYLHACSDIDDQVNFSHELSRQVQQRTTELYRKNEELQHERDFVETILDSSIDVMIVYSQDLRFLSFNRAAEKLYGKSRSEIIGKSLFEIYPDAKGSSNTDDLMRALKGEIVHHPRVKSSVVDIYFEYYIVPLRNAAGDIWAALVVARDVSDSLNSEMKLTQLNDSLVSKNQELERSNQELASFNHVASHDLQEPLRKIQTFISRLSDSSQFKLEGKTLEYFLRIQESAARMQLLIDDLLAFSRVNRVHESFEEVNLNSVLNIVQRELAVQIEEKGASIIAEELPVIKGVEFQMNQVLTNLLGNSLKYSRENVPPVVSIACAKATREEKTAMNVNNSDPFWRIEIKDNGIGFEPLYGEQIFELFQRLHGRKEYSGTGIGLTICKKIIENHGGRIQAVGKPNRGATFTILLPAIS